MSGVVGLVGAERGDGTDFAFIAKTGDGNDLSPFVSGDVAGGDVEHMVQHCWGVVPNSLE